ncbi:hypothetical protein NPIL_128321 [Nephila pilipes]|uniref:Uncharacterized protein n=1 Tax=Nephila pilipes TaxID=299642 RepID=A0A8X6QEF5_NEPPI|nr:hypothetical protein NPIL_128321 [Nephila pilipes]
MPTPIAAVTFVNTYANSGLCDLSHLTNSRLGVVPRCIGFLDAPRPPYHALTSASMKSLIYVIPVDSVVKLVVRFTLATVEVRDTPESFDIIRASSR